jgi:hypothetical protein
MAAMDLGLTIALVVALLLALWAARWAYRRDQEKRRRQRRALSSAGVRSASARSDMRAYDDTSTLQDHLARRARPAPPPAPPPARPPASQRGGRPR